MSATVGSAGIATTAYERDGAHLIFKDNTPGMNGNLVIFREGDGATQLNAYISTDGGSTWTKYQLTPGNALNMNVMGGVQDSVNHKFHMTWLDATNADQYGRWTPTYTSGNITGFTLDVAYGFFDDGGDTPGPREVTEIVDNAGNHRLAFVGTGPVVQDIISSLSQRSLVRSHRQRQVPGVKRLTKQ